MPTISERGRLMPASPIRKLVTYAEAAKKKGITVYHLNIGQPDIKTPAIALNALHHLQMSVIEYSHSAGIESYRQKLATYYRSLNIDVDYSQILITTGGSEAILFAFFSTMNIGDEVIIPEPFYTNYNAFARQAGVTIIPVVSKIENGFALPPIEDFEKLITPRTKGIMVCNPNNPTGYLYSEAEIRQLGTIAKKHDLYLFADEVYREFCYDGHTHFSVMQLEGLEKNAILLDSVSKRYSACGFRIGALVTRNKEVLDTTLKFAQARLSPPSFGQFAAEAALETPPEYFKEVFDEYVARRNFLVENLNKINGVFCPMPKGAFYAVVRLPIDDSEQFAQWLLEKYNYKNQTVMLAPAGGFYATPGLGKDEVRIAYVLKIEDLKIAVEVLKNALEAYPGKTKQSNTKLLVNNK